METLASLIERQGPLEAQDAVGWAIRLARSVEPIHALGVAHGNLSAEVVLAADAGCRSRGLLVDARIAHDRPGYHSPQRTEGGGLTPADDTWAVAVLLYFALTGTLPFPGADDAEVGERMKAGHAAPIAVFDAGDDALQRVLDGALARDLGARTATLSALRGALEAWDAGGALRGLAALDEEDEQQDGDEDEEDGATQVKDLASFQQHIAALKGKAAAPPAPTTPAARAPAAPPQAPRAPAAPAHAPRAPAAPAQAPRAPAALRPAAPAPVPARPAGPAVAPRSPIGGARAPSATDAIGAPPPARAAATPQPIARPATAASPPEPEAPRTPPPPPMDDDDSDEEAATSVMDSPLLAMQWQPAPQRPAAPARPPVGLGGTMMMPTPQPAPAPQSAPPPQPAPPPHPAPPPEPAPPQQAPDARAAEAPELPTMPLAPGGGAAPVPWQPAPAPASAPPPGAPGPATADAGMAGPAALDAPGPMPPPLQPASIPPRRSTPLLVLGALLVFAGGGAAAYLLLGRRPPAAPQVVASATAAPPTSASGVETVAASSAASAVAPASAAASAAPPPVGDPEACVAGLFAAGTFDAADGTKLSAVCTETDPRKGAVTLKAEAIRAGSSGSVQKVSDGMREWAILGWYEMAAFSVIRARCCPAAAPIALPTPEGCEPLDKVLTELGAAAAAAGDDAPARDVLARYTKAAHCVARSGAATRYGRGDRIEGGEETAFLKTLDRVRASTKP